MEFHVVPIDKPEDMNVVIGQAHFIKTVEDLHEALAGVSPSCASDWRSARLGPRLVRWSGNDDRLIELATSNALAIDAGHTFLVFLGTASR